MQVSLFFPCPQLSPFISKILYLRNDSSGNLESKMIPRGHPAFIFTFPDQPDIENKLHGVSRLYKPANVYFNGMVTASVCALFPAKSSFMLALLHPHCTGIFFREEANNFINGLYNVTNIDQYSRDVIDRIMDQPDIYGKIRVVETYLLTKIIGQIPCSVTERSMAAMCSGNGVYSVNELALRAYVSERNLRRKFMQHVGLSPKQYASIVRFRSVIKKIIAEKPVDWWQIVVDFGYYDLSHLSKDFNKYTGMSPEKYISQYHSIDAKFLPSL